MESALVVEMDAGACHIAAPVDVVQDVLLNDFRLRVELPSDVDGSLNESSVQFLSLCGNFTALDVKNYCGIAGRPSVSCVQLIYVLLLLLSSAWLCLVHSTAP